MKKVSMAFLAVAILVTALPACHSAASKEEKRKEKEQEQAAHDAQMKAAIPADSKLAKVDTGMSEGEVGAILGPPTSTDAHVTGKAFNPFNWGGKDTMRTVYYYKGLGRVEFSAGTWGQRNGVIDIQYDESEPGYRRTR